MARSDAAVFLENLKMWDRAEDGRGVGEVLKNVDDIEILVDEMFEKFCNLDLDSSLPFVGNC